MISRLKVVLVSPKIPQNTGSIVRSCAAVGAELILVRPLGFSLSDRHLKRAGLDYWEQTRISVWDDFKPLWQETDVWLFASKGQRLHSEARFSSDATLVFGSEDTGLPDELLHHFPHRVLRIPMRPGARCLNLAVSAAVGLYAAWQQQQYVGSQDSEHFLHTFNPVGSL